MATDVCGVRVAVCVRACDRVDPTPSWGQVKFTVGARASSPKPLAPGPSPGPKSRALGSGTRSRGPGPRAAWAPAPGPVAPGPGPGPRGMGWPPILKFTCASGGHFQPKPFRSLV